jgi:hypothetical protein
MKTRAKAKTPKDPETTRKDTVGGRPGSGALVVVDGGSVVDAVAVVVVSTAVVWESHAVRTATRDTSSTSAPLGAKVMALPLVSETETSIATGRAGSGRRAPAIRP